MNAPEIFEAFIIPEGKKKVECQTDEKLTALYTILLEDHTLGNMLKMMLLRNPKIRFAAYRKPHPLENKIEIHRFTYAYFKLENSFIEGTEIYRINLLNIFLKEQIDKNLCFEINNKFYYSYYCKKEVDISKMKNLYFYQQVKDNYI